MDIILSYRAILSFCHGGRNDIIHLRNCHGGLLEDGYHFISSCNILSSCHGGLLEDGYHFILSCNTLSSCHGGLLEDGYHFILSTIHCLFVMVAY